RNPSLLDREARGGDIAQGGFDYQRGIAMASLPDWLAQDGFSQLICEAMGDIEARFFVPGPGLRIEMLEVKEHQITPSEFWREVDRFRQLDQGCPGTYSRFNLVGRSPSPELEPIVKALDRVRRPAPFYTGDQHINQYSFADWVAVVEKAKRAA